MARALLLSDGRLEVDDVRALYDELWRVAATRRGAVTAAAKLLRLDSGRPPDSFDEYESAAIRQALRETE